MTLAESYSSHLTAVKVRVRLAFLAAAVVCLVSPTAGAAPLRGREVMLPMTCAELLPEVDPFTFFFEAVARGAVTSHARLSKRMFRVLSLREKLSEQGKRHKEDNPIDSLLRKTLCFYRESKDPVRAIPFDDPTFLKFMETSIDEVENKAEDSVYQSELSRLQKEEYEKRLERNQELIEQLRAEADRSAQRSYDDLSKKARRKVQSP